MKRIPLTQGKLDNRRENLRSAMQAQQIMNGGLRRNNKSGFKGVSYFKQTKKWQAYIRHKYKRYHLGYFTNKLDAARAYNKVAKKLFSEFARLNKC